MTVVFRPRALRDLRSIHDYIAHRSPTGAASVMLRIESTIDLIARHPGVGRAVEQRPGVRSLPVGKYPYQVYYQWEDDMVVVLHVRHGARRAPRSTDLG